MGLTNEEINNLLGVADAQTTQLVNKIVREKLLVLKDKFKLNTELETPVVVFDLHGTTAGYAIGGHTIRLNVDLLNNPKHREQILHNTLPHEVAHIFVRQVFGRGSDVKGHGWQWRLAMQYLGLEPERCHTMEVKNARKMNKFEYRCDCVDKRFKISATTHNRIQGGKAYRCRTCRQPLEYVRDL